MLVTSRTTNVLLLLVLATGIGIVAMLAAGGRAGPLDPAGAPGSTLPQVEPRSPIPPVGWNATFPIVISQPGSYFLTRNLTTPGSVNGIFITSDDVSIDLNGFTLTSPDKAGSGVETDGFSDTVRVRNGTVRGFANPIRLFGSRSHVSDVRVTGFGTGTGITIGRDGVVEDCAVVLGDGDGVWIQDISVLRRCAVKQVAGSGVVASIGALVEGNSINANAFTATTYGIETVGQETTIRDNTLSNGARDIGVAFHGHVIIDNVIHCATSIVNLGTFSYWAPVNTEAHANQPAFAAGFC